MTLRTRRVAIIGAGLGGLAAAIDLAGRGLEVTLLERHDRPGGKMRGAGPEDGFANGIDAGPTVLTMASVFEALFADHGRRLADRVRLERADLLARHVWRGGADLDLHADRARSADAIARFASPADARGYLRLCEDSGRIFATLEGAMLRAPKPSMAGLLARCGPRALLGIRPFETLWHALGGYFADPRLRQLFGRYATYVGSSPFAAPATTMLIAHLEQEGVWLVEGGMRRLAAALADLATELGARLRTGVAAARLETRAGRIVSLGLADGERLETDAVICNADPASLATGAIGGLERVFAPSLAGRTASLSAVTWTLRARTSGRALARHNVLFGASSEAEFADLFERRTIPADPTIYLCAQDRPGPPPDEGERLLLLVNAPASAPGRIPPAVPDGLFARVLERLAGEDLALECPPPGAFETGPASFARQHPGSGGALYGGVTHGWRSTFQRPGARTPVPNLYLAGGGVHPGPGVPMATLSGRLAASALIADLTSPSASRRTAMSGGMSTRSRIAVGTR